MSGALSIPPRLYVCERCDGWGWIVVSPTVEERQFAYEAALERGEPSWSARVHLLRSHRKERCQECGSGCVERRDVAHVPP